MSQDYREPWSHTENRGNPAGRNNPLPGRPLFPGPLTLIAFVLIIGLLGYQVARWALDRDGDLNNPDAQPRVVTPRGDLASDEKSTIELYDQNRSSVVHITSLVAARRSRFSLDTMNIPAGTGSGFLWDDSGYIVTNFHVIQEASGAEVTLAGEKTSYKADLVGGYPEMDLAVLKINARGRKLRPIPVGTSSDLKVGQKVFAIGNPFGLDQTLTTGIISALDRELQGESGNSLKNLIQTDAAINPGNSGGPLLDSAGRLIGVNTAILSQNGGSNGIGFAIAVDDVNQIVPQLIRNGRVVRPVIGVSLLGENFARENGIQGLVVRGVEPDGPAAKAGIVGIRLGRGGVSGLGDILRECEGVTLKELRDLHSVMEKKKPGDTVKFKIERDGEVRELLITLSEPKSFQPIAPPR